MAELEPAEKGGFRLEKGPDTFSMWNERLGWLLLIVGLSAAVGLDPWSLSERDPAVLPGSARMAARHAQAVVLAMGFLQLAVARLLGELTHAERLRRIAGPVLAVGTLVYSAGYVGLTLWPGHAWPIPIGAALNLSGFAVLGWAACRSSVAAEVRVALAIFLFGMAIDVASGLYAVDAERFLPAYIGPEVGVRQRMLRLARVAATALSVLTLLFRDLCPKSALGGWGRLAMMVGTLGMPTVLTAACFVWLDLKYLLPLPALAMTGGTLLGLLWARRTASALEQWGWLLIVLSMSVGLVIGLYAFDGPLPTPAFVGPYNQFVRRLIRLGHAYAIMLGLLAILLARHGAGRRAVSLFLAGTCVTLPAIGLLAFLELPTVILAPGPGLIVLALLVGIYWSVPPGEKGRDISPPREPEKEMEPTP
jgi:hypothetical protein